MKAKIHKSELLEYYKFRGFKLPTAAEALAFYLTELGEAIDAFLRLRDQDMPDGFKRNNKKHVTKEDLFFELADCYQMLALTYFLLEANEDVRSLEVDTNFGQETTYEVLLERLTSLSYSAYFIVYHKHKLTDDEFAKNTILRLNTLSVALSGRPVSHWLSAKWASQGFVMSVVTKEVQGE